MDHRHHHAHTAFYQQPKTSVGRAADAGRGSDRRAAGRRPPPLAFAPCARVHRHSAARNSHTATAKTTEMLFQHLEEIHPCSVARFEEPVESLARGAPFELKLEVEFKSIDTHQLEPRLATYFLRELDESMSLDPDWSNFDDPVHVELQVDSTEIEVFDMLEADDYFVFLAAFSRTLHCYQLAVSQAGEDENLKSYSPLVVDKIQLNLNRFCITSRVVAAARAFMKAGIPVDTRVINLDPRLVSCSSDELQNFVRDVSKDATNFLIMTGVDIYEEAPPSIDRHGQDRSDAISAILLATEWVKPLHEVRPAGLLTLCSQTVNRQAIFRGVFEYTLDRAVLPDLLTFDSDFTLTDQDAEWIREYSAQWRLVNRGRKCCMKQLQVLPLSMSSSALYELLAAFDDAEEVSIWNVVDPNAIDWLLLVLRYPSLHSLFIANASITTMDLFDPSINDPRLPRKPLLKQILLRDVTIQDTASIPRFMESLKPSSRSTLAASLRQLQIWQRGVSSQESRAHGHAAMLSLDGVLQANRVLTDVRVFLHGLRESSAGVMRRLQFYHQAHIPTSLSKRRVEYAKARNLAFLSVIRDDKTSPRTQLDARVVSLIFDFSAPTERRRVEVAVQ